MTHLATLQAQFQRRVLRGDAAIEPQVAGRAQDVALRLGIYEHAYRARLKEALGIAYPVLKECLGHDAFDAVAATYIDSRPPTHRSIRWYGAALHRELRGMHAELARWEWLLGEVFDAADDRALTEADLARLAPTDWPALRLRLHRTVRFCETTTNAVACWQAAAAHAPLPPPRDPERLWWVVWRRDVSTRFRSTPLDEVRAFMRLGAGATFADLCADLARDMTGREAAMRAATWLKRWIGEGLIGRGC